jgi:hypothetical protein
MPVVTRTFRHQNGTPARNQLVGVRDAATGAVVTSDVTNASGLFAAWLEPGSYQFDVDGLLIPFTVAPGGDLPSSGRYVHTQSAPAALWNVSHNLGTKPNVVLVVDSDPTEPVITDVFYTDDNHLTVEWPSPESGKAYLS